MPGSTPDSGWSTTETVLFVIGSVVSTALMVASGMSWLGAMCLSLFAGVLVVALCSYCIRSNGYRDNERIAMDEKDAARSSLMECNKCKNQMFKLDTVCPYCGFDRTNPDHATMTFTATPKPPLVGEEISSPWGKVSNAEMNAAIVGAIICLIVGFTLVAQYYQLYSLSKFALGGMFVFFGLLGGSLGVGICRSAMGDSDIDRVAIDTKNKDREAKLMELSPFMDCNDCKKQISKKASACPHCGCPNQEAKLSDKC